MGKRAVLLSSGESTYVDRVVGESDSGIIVYGFRRPLHLENTLESLVRQDVNFPVYVFLDGPFRRSNEVIALNQQCRDLRAKFSQFEWAVYHSNVGIEKLMLDGLSVMAKKHENIIVLEDDCFPTRDAIRVFSEELDEIRDDPTIYSVYGHHFLSSHEGAFCPRFQGWGWATTRTKLQRLYADLRQCFLWPEPHYLQWVRQRLTPEVLERINMRGRNPVGTLRLHYTWDSCTVLLTAIHGWRHKRSKQRIIYNCGMGEGSRFLLSARHAFLREPPFNMITPDEVWELWDAPSKAL